MPSTLPQGGVRYFRRFLFDTTQTESDWSLGMVRDVPRQTIPVGGSYQLTDFFIDKPGMLYKRGGTSYLNSPLSGQVDVVAVAAPEFSGDPRVLAIGSDGASTRTLFDVTSGTPATGIGVGISQPYENLPFYIDRLILTSGEPKAGPFEPVKKIYLSGGTVSVALLGGLPPPASVSCVHGGRLVLGNTHQYPGRIFFSPDGDIEGLPIAITSANSTTDTFVIPGDETLSLPVGSVFSVTGSTSNNGTYTVLSSVWATGTGTGPGTTTVTVASVPSSTGTMGNLVIGWDTVNSWIETGSPIMGMASIQGSLLVFSRGRCQRVIHDVPPGHVDANGNPSTNMELQPLGNVGCIDGRTICYANNLCYFANETGIYSTNGSGFDSLTQKPNGTGISELWQDTMRGFSPALGALVSMGVYQNQYLLVSVIHNSGVKSQFLCYLPDLSWVQLSQTCNATMYAPSFAPTHELHIGSSADTRVRKLSSMWSPGGTTKNDAEGTPVTPVWESRLVSNTVARKRYGFAHLSYDLRDAASDNPSLRTEIASGLEADTSYAAVKQSPLQETSRSIRKRFTLYKDTQGLSYRFTQQNASAKTEIYYLETEIGPYYVADGQ